MSGPHKHRCLGKTAGGGRCKRRLHTEYSYCPIHADQRVETLEIDHDAAIELFECFKDGDSSERLCGHSCGLSLENCCECTDKRAVVPATRRGDGYCTICKPRYVGRLPPPPPPAPLRRLIEFRNAVVFEIDEDGAEMLEEMIGRIRNALDAR
jgi:hypothetical protein